MKLAYLTVNMENIDLTSPGVHAKIKNHINTFNKNKIYTDLYNFNFIDKTTKYYRLKMDAIVVPFCSDAINWDKYDLSKYDALYIRRTYFITNQLFKFLKKIKKRNPNVKILFEIPTYPYDREYTGWWEKLLLNKERMCRNNISKYVDRIVTVIKHEKVFGCKTIYMPNGVNVDKIKSKTTSKDNKNKINIICVATFAKWHGYDRLITGLAKYYKEDGKRKIYIHMVGDGPALKDYKKLILQYNLQEYFIFYGLMKAKDIDRVYNKCSFACSSIGTHRIDLQCLSTLKSSEYLAKGIPFIYSGDIDIFKTNKQHFCYKVPSNDEPIDFIKFLKFYDKLYSNNTEATLIKIIRRYAVNTVSMDITMKGVIDYLLKPSKKSTSPTT